MALIHRQIFEHFDANEWAKVGETPHGVCIFEIYKNGKPKAKGTLLELGDIARDARK